MPKGRKITIKAKDEPDPQDMRTWKEAPGPLHSYDQTDAELDEVFSDFPQNEACIELYRINPQGGRPFFLETLAPASFEFSYVAEKFGGGKYKAKGKYKDGSRVQYDFDIEGDPFPLKRIKPSDQVKVDGEGTRYQPVSFQPITDQPGDFTPGTDATQALVQVMRAMLTEMKNSELNMLEKMRLYKDLFAPPVQPSTPIETAITMFQKGVEMAGMAEGGGGPWWLPILRELKEPLTKIVDTVQMSVAKQPIRTAPVQPRQVGAVDSSTLPGASPVSPAQTSEPQSLTTMEPDQVMMLQLKAILPMLINGAAKNTEPEFYAGMVLDQLPGSSYTAFRDWLLKPDCLEQLAQIEPGIRFQQEWWGELRGLLLAALNEELGHAVRPIHPRETPDPTTKPPPDHDEVS